MSVRRTVSATALLGLLALGCNDHRTAGGYYVPDHIAEPGDPCADDLDCVVDATCFEGTCVGDGALRVSLAWERRTDADLHVRLPSGAEIDYTNPDHPTGHLDIDDCVLICSNFNGPHIENVFFTEEAQHGTYEVWVVNFNGLRSTDFYVEVAGENIMENFDGHLDNQTGYESTHWTFEYPGPDPGP